MQIIWLIAIVVVWFVLMKWVLPKLGITTCLSCNTCSVGHTPEQDSPEPEPDESPS